jgi:hypothetical protein
MISCLFCVFLRLSIPRIDHSPMQTTTKLGGLQESDLVY